MTSPLTPSLTEEQLADIERSLQIIGAGLPREIPVNALPPKLVDALKAGRIAVRQRK
ncbi:hypothetical protein OH708_08360 [Pseudomonas capsici]|uniref:hypothetical protein n=1 Tax=Pseudomonas capsici TaxID=2810614 RepID=UPI0021F24899|nr:hypothetical protein [Pseudomonas capsici]MCV4287915.1 hypothetical protein [Pseudomonas capsici]